MKKIFKKIVEGILAWESRVLIKRKKPHVIAVTGSVGKTSSKDAIFAVLSEKYDSNEIRRSEKSYNSTVGISLTILRLPNAWNNPFGWLSNIVIGFFKAFFSKDYPEQLVLETGVGTPGDMEIITKIIKPDIVVVTGLGRTPVHVEFFKSKEDLFNEKGKLVEALNPNGVLILNRDDELVYKMREKTKARVMSYGQNQDSNIRVLATEPIFENEELKGISARLDYDGKSLPLRVSGVLGMGHIYSSLAGISVGLIKGMNLLEAVAGIERTKFPPGRMRILKGIKRTTIIDDSYNASPKAVKNALDALAEIKTSGRRIAVLGKMAELGDFSDEAHLDIGAYARGKSDLLICIEDEGERIKEGAIASGYNSDNISLFEDALAAGKYLQNLIDKGDIILVKGSQSVRMEKTVKEIMLEPDKAKELLVRQEKEWDKR